MHRFISWFQNNYPGLVQTMKDSDHHYDINTLNPYHLESDVWTHTMMVCNIADYLKYNDLVKIACLLHDIGKPLCREENHDKKRVSFYMHEPLSGFMALNLLKTPIFELQEHEILFIFKLICLHTEVFKLTPDKLAERFVDQSSLYDNLFDLATADSTGRFSEDLTLLNQEPLIPRILANKDRTVTLLVGPPAAGKSSSITEEDRKTKFIVSRDEIITNMFPELSYSEAWTKADQKKVDRLLQAEFKEANKSNLDVIVDMTHMSRKSRRRTLSHFPRAKFNYKAEVYVTGINELYKRNKNRTGKEIADHVILRMVKSFYPPMYDEFDYIDWNLT